MKITYTNLTYRAQLQNRKACAENNLETYTTFCDVYWLIITKLTMLQRCIHTKVLLFQLNEILSVDILGARTKGLIHRTNNAILS